MVGAWAAGRLDKLLAATRRTDRQWWARLHLALDAYEAERSQTYLTLLHARALAGTLSGDLVGDRDFARKQWHAASEHLAGLTNLLFPWEQHQRLGPQEEAARMTEQWEKVFGKRDDPATQAAIAWTAQQLSAQRVRK